MHRRKFLQTAGSLAGVAALNPSLETSVDALAAREALNPLRIGVLQGPTSNSRTILTVVAHKELGLSFEVSGGSQPAGLEVIPLDLGVSEYLIYHLHIDGLELGSTYRMVMQDSLGRIQGERSFQALDWRRRDIRLGVASCMNHRNSAPQALMTKQMNQADPDALIFIGDLVYANSVFNTVSGKPASPANAYFNYVKTFNDLDFYQRPKLTPVFSSWDDHDMGQDNSNSAHPWLETMKRMFRGFFPLGKTEIGCVHGPGMSFALKAFGLQILVLDQRTFSTKTQRLGPAQLKWAKSIIDGSDCPLLIFSPLLFWKYHFWGESFQKNASAELQVILDSIKALQRPCVLFSGDVHYSQIQELDPKHLGFKSYEITSSAMFSGSAGRWGRRKDSGQLEYYGYANFILLDEFVCDENSLDLRVSCVSETSLAQFQRRLRIET